MATTALRNEMQEEKDNRNRNAFDMMGDCVKAESQACESVAKDALRIFSLQADETEAQLQSKDLGENDRNRLFEERASIRRDVLHVTDSFTLHSYLKLCVIASVFAAGIGATRYALRRA